VPSLVLALAFALALNGAGRVRALMRALFFLPVMARIRARTRPAPFSASAKASARTRLGTTVPTA
jgi:hypothetical protein